MFYGYLMGVYLEPSPGYEPPSHPVARQVFDEVHTIHSRVQLVKKLADWDDQQKKDVLGVLEKVKNAGKSRNKVVHGVWGVCESEPDTLKMLLNRLRLLGRVHNIFYQSRKK